MTVEIEILEKLFNDFTEFVKPTDKRPFTDFRTSPFMESSENYKYAVYDKAREKLQNKFWKQEYIGTEKIKQYVISAIQTRVHYNYESVDNNLITVSYTHLTLPTKRIV